MKKIKNKRKMYRKKNVILKNGSKKNFQFFFISFIHIKIYKEI